MSIEFKVPAGNRIVLEEVADCLRRIAGRLPVVVPRSNPFEGCAAGTLEEFAANTGTTYSSARKGLEEFTSEVVSQVAEAYQVPVETLTVDIPAPPAAVIPPPPAVVTPPPAIVPAPPVTTNSVELDSEGLPWDQRIHASTKTKRQSDKTWKLIKGSNPAIVAAVKAELRSAMGSVVPPPVERASIVTPVPPVAGIIRPTTEEMLAAVIPTPPPAAAAPAAAPPAVATATPTFPELVQIVSKHMGDGTIAMTEVQDICKANGFAALPLVNHRLEMIPTILAQMEAVWSTRQPMLG